MTSIEEARELLEGFVSAIRIPGHPFEKQGRALRTLLDALSQAEGVIERAYGLTVVNKTPQGFVKSYAPNLEALDGLHGDCATFLASLKEKK